MKNVIFLLSLSSSFSLFEHREYQSNNTLDVCLFYPQSKGHTCVRQHVPRISFNGLNTDASKKVNTEADLDLIKYFHVSSCQCKQTRNFINLHEYFGIKLYKLNYGNGIRFRSFLGIENE